MDRSTLHRRFFYLRYLLLGLSLVRPAFAAPLTITVPPAANNIAYSTSLRFGPDGLLYAWNGAHIFKQNGVNVDGFTSIGSVTTAGADAGPINFSQDGKTLLIGDGAGGKDFSGNSNGLLYTLPSSGGSTSTSAGTEQFQQDFIAVPAASSIAGSSTKFFVDHGFDFSGTSSAVDVFDYVTGTAKPVIQNIPGASSSVALDASNRLYVGVGYGTNQGQIRSFSLSAIDAAFAKNSPNSALDWTNDGTPFYSPDDSSVSFDSGSGMFFDSRRLLFVGGPDGLTVVNSSGVSRTYVTGVGSFPQLLYNPANDQFAVAPFGVAPTILDAPQFTVPEPSAAILALLGGSLLLCLHRRRRRKLRSS
jgi:PEP-CTERM motif-containing protein